MANLLLVDDDLEVLEINRKYLEKEGFNVSICSDPTQVIDMIKTNEFHCIILDIMMPMIDGIAICKTLRGFSSIPVLFLTGKSSENDKVEGLVSGADDYVVKPYSLRELKARIDVLLRRTSTLSSTQNSNLLTFGNLDIDLLAHKALFKGTDLLLSNREFELLALLASRPDQLITFEEIGTALFGIYTENDRRSVMVNMSRLRKKMNIDFELENRFETVWGKGYIFNN